MSDKFQELEIVKEICQKLDGLEESKQTKILNWVADVLEIPRAQSQKFSETDKDISSAFGAAAHSSHVGEEAAKKKALDIKSFVQSKKPASDVQFVTAVAYFHQFEAIPKKEVVSVEDLKDAVRLASWKRFARWDTPFSNAVSQGLLDRGKEKGTYKINSVGENLVALAMPSQPKARK
jgi:hypothetical protein